MTSTEFLWTLDELQPHEIQSVFRDTILSFVIVSQHIDQTLSNYVKYMEPWLRYPWNFKQPQFQALTFNVVEYIYGELNYHEHVLDMELFIAILLDFTKYEDCYVHVFDSVTLEPVLATCHDELRAELQDVTTSRNRVWLHDGGCIVLNRLIDQGGYLPLQEAIKQIFVGDYKQDDTLTTALKNKCNLDTGLSHVHDVTFTFPVPVAKLATADPMVVAKSLEALENEEEVEPLVFEEGMEVTLPVNSVHLGVLLGIASALGKPRELSGIVLSGLQKYYAGKEEPKVPETIKPSSRTLLQDELMNRGIILERVPEDTELVEMIADINKPQMEDEEQYARNLQQVFEEGLDEFEDMIDEEYAEERDNETDDDLTDDDLNVFRWRYYDISSEWLPRDQVAQKYQEFKTSILHKTAVFKDDFKNTEFEDFPEFLESEIILEMSGVKNKYGDDSDQSDDATEIYQGDMAYDEYLKFRSKLRQEGANVSDEEPEDDDDDDDDDDWENVDDDDDAEGDDELVSDDSDEDIAGKYVQKPVLETLDEEPSSLEYEELDPKLTKREIERLTSTMKSLRTSEDTNLESKIKKGK
ncbi:hypothetical protein KGF57_003234 [Candida theae]|uniref:Uncharacterized protein n=1 Tax=Candida theae TaxID=1198502 RepID=A0AAD5BDD8_9ASCO|nr:uncharacterized protein KGF57_003234 [Candida theae]KAI5957540.1 hypothetical protein KGF57_003234 [Candida theae]